MTDALIATSLPCSRSESLARKFCEHSNADDTFPKLLVCWPSTTTNKYQSLLYRSAAKFGYAVERIRKLSELEEIFWPGQIVFHAHWFAQLSKSASEQDEFRRNIDEAFNQLLAFQQRTDCKLVWTAHNLLPHNSPYPDVDIELRRRIVGDFDLVHFMDENHPALLEDLIGMRPNRELVVPHPHYGPAQADYVSRAEARDAMGFEPSSTILLFFGSIRPYKGLEALIAAFRKVRSETRPELRLIIAGIPSDRDYARLILETIDDDMAIKFVPHMVADEHVQLYFRAADGVVLPYTGSQLNSGAAMLALTFGCPVIAPNEPAFMALADYGVTTYDKEQSGSLSTTLAKISLSRRARSQDFRMKFDPDKISDLFFSGLDEILVPNPG